MRLEVAPIITVFGTAASEANPSIIRAKTPLSFHRFQRVFGGPYSLGASRKRKQLRVMKIIPLQIRRSSTRGLPWLLGKRARAAPSAPRSARNGCSSVNLLAEAEPHREQMINVS
jgi:hypothetical protein